MIVEYVRYQIDPNKTQAFEAAYQSAQEQLEASSNCLGFDLARATGKPGAYVLRIHWDSAEGHMQGFRKGPHFASFLKDIKPYIDDLEEMQHYELTDVNSASSIYDQVGGAETFFRLARTMHEKMHRDPLLGERFQHAAPTHVPHLAMWLTEVFGGPKLYSVTLDNIGPMLKRHAGQDIEEEARKRFSDLAIEATTEVLQSVAGLDDNVRAGALQSIGGYMDWGTKIAVENSKPGHVADPEAGVPTWDWDATA